MTYGNRNPDPRAGSQALLRDPDKMVEYLLNTHKGRMALLRALGSNLEPSRLGYVVDIIDARRVLQVAVGL